jgi:hypothetical protein
MAGKGNPYHKPGGKGGGQFTTGPGGLGKFKLVGGPIGVGTTLEGLPADHPTRKRVDELAKARGFDNAQQAIDECVERIEKMVNPTSIRQGRRWYMDEHDFQVAQAKKFKVSPEAAIGAMSALSPRCSPRENRGYAEAVLAHHKEFDSAQACADGVHTGALGANTKQAWSVVSKNDPDVLTGVKRRSFYNNMLFPGRTSDVTVDTQVGKILRSVAIKHAEGASKPILPPTGKKDTAQEETMRFVSEGAGTKNMDAGAGYYILADAIRKVARNHKESPDTIQTVVWSGMGGGKREQ